MPNFGKPDKTGRSSGRRVGRAGKAHRPPKHEPWVWHTRKLFCSPSWRARSINCVRLLSFLEVEYMNHAGRENGNLKATYDQLVASGMTRGLLRAAIEEAEFLGLLRFERGGRWAGSNQPSIYRLTYLPDRDDNPPSNEWKLRTQDQIEEWKRNRSERKKAVKQRKQKQFPGASSRTTVVPLPELREIAGSSKS